MRSEGYSLAEIGRRFGVSRQRVDQIVRRAGGAAVGLDSSRARRAREATERRELHARLARDRSGEILECYRNGAQLQVIARDLGLQHEAVRGLIDRSRTEADRAARGKALQRAGRPQYSDAELRRAIRLIADRVGRAPTCEQYDHLARELGLASLPTVYMRFGGWNRAVRAAGLEPSGADRIRTARWPLAACWRAVQSVADQLGDPPRYRRYVALSASRDDLPSPATVRQRLGLWSHIAAVIMEERASDGRGPATSVRTPTNGHRPVERFPAAGINVGRPRQNAQSATGTSGAALDASPGRLPSRLEVRALAYLAERPGSGGRAAGRGLGIRHDSQAWALLNRLERDGLLAKAPNGAASAWTLTDRGQALLRHLPERGYA